MKCRLSCHPRISIGCSGYYAFKQAKYGAYALYLVDCSDKVHLRGAGVGEADFYVAIHKRFQ
jgi:hypothetical protein